MDTTPLMNYTILGLHLVQINNTTLITLLKNYYKNPINSVSKLHEDTKYYDYNRTILFMTTHQANQLSNTKNITFLQGTT